MTIDRDTVTGPIKTVAEPGAEPTTFGGARGRPSMLTASPSYVRAFVGQPKCRAGPLSREARRATVTPVTQHQASWPDSGLGLRENLNRAYGGPR
jgi:hypothetical protein